MSDPTLTWSYEAVKHCQVLGIEVEDALEMAWQTEVWPSTASGKGQTVPIHPEAVTYSTDL